MKYLICIVFVLIAGCSKPVSQWTVTAPQDIPGMPGCTYQFIDRGDGGMRVIRCTNSSVSTTYQQGKHSTTIYTTDNGVE